MSSHADAEDPPAAAPAGADQAVLSDAASLLMLRAPPDDSEEEKPAPASDSPPPSSHPQLQPLSLAPPLMVMPPASSLQMAAMGLPAMSPMMSTSQPTMVAQQTDPMAAFSAGAKLQPGPQAYGMQPSPQAGLGPVSGQPGRQI